MKDEWNCSASSSPPTSACSLPTPSFRPHSLLYSCHWYSTVFSLFSKLRHTVWVWRSGQLQQHCKWVLIIPQTREREQGSRREGVSSLRLCWSRIGWVSHTAVEYKCGISGIEGEWWGEGSCKKEPAAEDGEYRRFYRTKKEEWEMFRRAKNVFNNKVINQMRYEFHKRRNKPFVRSVTETNTKNTAADLTTFLDVHHLRVDSRTYVTIESCDFSGVSAFPVISQIAFHQHPNICTSRHWQW